MDDPQHENPRCFNLIKDEVLREASDWNATSVL